MNEKSNKLMISIMSIILLIAMVMLSRKAADYIYTSGTAITNTSTNPVIVIDAGHGGIDPGKVSVDGTLEKDINLAIALKLQTLLEANNITVVMTRTTDEGLYEESDSNKKVQDMKNRVTLMESATPDAIVSIHQNSYTDSSVKGSQVFYYTDSVEGSSFASLMQSVLVSHTDPDNHRQAKGDNSYYILKYTTAPTIIVECGFLSNPTEAALLANASYQDEMAWAIHIGILQYLNGVSV
ncbi:MAG: N-acetylmuramoyl-L-alanine amidase [Lachnospiraceae bacterium]